MVARQRRRRGEVGGQTARAKGQHVGGFLWTPLRHHQERERQRRARDLGDITSTGKLAPLSSAGRSGEFGGLQALSTDEPVPGASGWTEDGWGMAAESSRC